MKKIKIQKNVYFDSVSLMLITRDVKTLDGVKDANICMGTDHNKELLDNIGLLTNECKSCSPNDLIIALDGTEEFINNAENVINESLTKKNTKSSKSSKYSSLKRAAEEFEKSNFVVISVPGEFAAAEAEIALKLNKHVMLFSDNVSIDEEVKLKTLAKENQLLMMGPDCGTAIINGKPLGFANKVSSGNIGITGASGTGIQEVSTIIDKLGLGISQAIGTGGRDLSKNVNGIMMELGIEALAGDNDTDVIILISKPPHPDVATKIIEKAKTINKPFVINFLGQSQTATDNLIFCSTLEETAITACRLAAKKEEFDAESVGMPEMLDTEFTSTQKYLRGLYTGGTLCDEAMLLSKGLIPEIYSNTPVKDCYELKDPFISEKNAFVDLGDDTFTRGKPHPMIEPDTRNQRIIQESKDPEVAVILLDFVLGYGAHKDPVGICIPFIQEAQKNNPNLCFIASVTGTGKDPQDLNKQTTMLVENSVILASCNAQAAILAASIIKEIN
ncbi:MAG: acyl-CoA synthetase FdrA [Cyanobacteriota bacterium]